MKVLSKEEYDENGNLLLFIANEYNDDLQLTKVNHYDSQKVLNAYILYEYDLHGNTLIVSHYNKYDHLYFKVEQEYDEKNRIIKKLIVEEEEIIEWEEYLFPNEKTEVIIFKNENGDIEEKLIKDLTSGIWEHRNQFDKLDYKEQLVFNSKGQMLTRKCFDKNTTPQLIEHDYNYRGNIEYWAMYMDKKLIRAEERIFDTQNQLVSIIQKSNIGETLSITNYEYDEYGNHISYEYTATGQATIVRKFVINYLSS